MPAFKPTTKLDALDYITRHPVGSHHPGWDVSIEFAGHRFHKRFKDRGDAPAALAQAISWRDEQIQTINTRAGQALSSGKDGTGFGVRITTSTTGGIEYDVVKAQVPAVGAHEKKRIVRSISKYGLDDAVAQCARFRFDGMRERYGDEYPFESAEELAQAVLDAQAELT